jgi:hypothetical protein
MYGLITVGVIKRKLFAQDTDIKMSYMPDKKMMKAEPNGLEPIGIVPIPSKDVGAVWPVPEIGGEKVVLIESDIKHSKEVIDIMLARGLEADPPMLINPISMVDAIDMYAVSHHTGSPDVHDPRAAKIEKLNSYGVGYDISDFTDEQLDLALKVIGGYKNGARCGCGARADYYTKDGFVCFEHSGMSLSSATPTPLKIPEIIGGPKNRAERRKQKSKTWKGDKYGRVENIYNRG